MAGFTGWEAALLRALHAPVTKANVSWLDQWQSSEGGSAAYNPLNTTQPEKGASDYNGVGVKSYTSAAQGIAATAATLLNGRYTHVVAALRSGNPQAYANRSAKGDPTLIAQLKTWGSTGFAGDVGSNEVGDTGPTLSNTGASATASAAAGLAGGLFGGLEKWLAGIGKLVLAYVLLAGVAVGLFLTGLKGLGVPTPKAPVVVPV